MQLSKLWRDDRALGAILLLALMLGLVYNFTVLPGFAPDEPRHFAYVRLLVEERRFPFLMPGGGEYRGAHSLHPPLYYLLLAPFYALLQGLSPDAIYHALRAISLLLCLGALVLLYDVAHRASAARDSGQRGTARLAVALFALTPMFGMTAGAVNNDAASVFATALFWWLLSRCEGELKRRDVLLLGLVFGLGMLCKATVALCDGAALVAFLWARHGLKSPLFWRSFAFVLSLALVVALPWYARNFALYGKFSPIESGYSSPALPSPSAGILVMMMHPNFPALFGFANWGIFYSLWSQKDWFPAPTRTPIYLGFVALVLGAVVGQVKARLRAPKIGDFALRAALYGAFALNWAACAGMALFVHWGWAEGGRYLVAALPALTFFIAAGWSALFSSRAMLVTSAALLLALNGLCIWWLLSYLNPTFGPR